MAMKPQSPIDPYKDYSTLSFRDLVEARDFYHRQLMRKQNVVGTLWAGLYCASSRAPTAKKTLSNSEITKNSAVSAVFVKEWADDSEFGSGDSQCTQRLCSPSIEMRMAGVPLCV